MSRIDSSFKVSAVWGLSFPRLRAKNGFPNSRGDITALATIVHSSKFVNVIFGRILEKQKSKYLSQAAAKARP